MAKEDVMHVLDACHTIPYGGHFVGTDPKSFKVAIIDQHSSKMSMNSQKGVTSAREQGTYQQEMKDQ